jgi:hypothetical protein
LSTISDEEMKTPLSRNIWSHFEHNIRRRNEEDTNLWGLWAKSYSKHKSLAKRTDAGNKQWQ